MRARFVTRARILIGLVALISFALIGRLYFVQIVYGEQYTQEAKRQYVSSSQPLFNRGEIFFRDRDGRLISGATTRGGYFLAINPMLISNPAQVFSQLSSILELDETLFMERATRVDDPYEEIAQHILPADAERIRALNLPGVRLYRQRWRYYPGETLAAHTLGFIAYGEDGKDRRGRYGLERFYDDTLHQDAQRTNINFFAELFARIGDDTRPSKKLGGDVVTSIEPSVQLYLEQELATLRATWRGKQAGGIIMDPMNGRLYAMAINPTFDVNSFSLADPSLFQNALTESVFEMGSILKPITIAIGLDVGVIRPETTYYDSGVYAVDGYRISNYDGRGRGTVTMQDALNNSLNTGMAFIVERVGRERFGSHLKRFAIGEKTGIDLPNETHGLVRNLDSPRMVEFATASFGQGIALTPIATVRALAALANGGYLVTPHVGTEVHTHDGNVQTLAYPQGARVLSPEASEEITRMLVNVVDTSLRGGAYKQTHYSIAAKTGTAQIASAESRGYYDDRFLHTFFGYFPAFEPRFIVFLYSLEPQGARYASETLTEPFMHIAKYLINYYNIPPDR